MDYRTHQRRLLPALAKTYALSFAQLRLIDQLHEVFTNEADDRDRRELETLAAGVKSIATWHATETIQSCREACGGAGYLRANRFAALKADTDVFTTFEGDNTILLQLAAKNLLTDYKDEFGELDPLGMARFVAGQALGADRREDVAAQARRRRRPARPRHPARPVPVALRAPARRRRAPAQARHRRRARPVLGADRQPGPRRRDRARVGRPRRARVVPGGPGRRQAPQPVRAAHDRDPPRLLPGARAHLGRPLEGGDQGRQRAVRGAAPGRAGAGRRVRRARRACSATRRVVAESVPA